MDPLEIQRPKFENSRLGFIESVHMSIFSVCWYMDFSGKIILPSLVLALHFSRWVWTVVSAIQE